MRRSDSQPKMYGMEPRMKHGLNTERRGGPKMELSRGFALRPSVGPVGRGSRTIQCVGFATQRWTILPLPKGEGGVRGKQRSKHQCACDRAPSTIDRLFARCDC